MRRRFVLSVVILILYMGIIFWISSLPNEQLIPEAKVGIVISSSIKHLGECAILGILMSLVMAQISNKTLSVVFYSSLFSSCYGVLDEIHQSFVPTRCCTVSDMYIDTLGSIVGVLFYVVLARYFQHKSHQDWHAQ